ncbi:hypothetical protein AV530_015499 [Patagioenas fasciata monilis]|uniref:Uncharacterized protein n=1 Tax=Patagioenas fasciata monilis TaxID=372326 RepID=A0A1V4KRT6_PATFA|nr:hypothetical protein AV530_015499 [Patagioenas fasciata monilis]
MRCITHRLHGDCTISGGPPAVDRCLQRKLLSMVLEEPHQSPHKQLLTSQPSGTDSWSVTCTTISKSKH